MYLPIEKVKQLEFERQSDLLKHRTFTNGLVFTFNDKFDYKDDDNRITSVKHAMADAFRDTNRDIEQNRCAGRTKMRSKRHSYYYQIETGFTGRPHIHMLLDLSNYHPETQQQFLNNLDSSYCGKNKHNPKIGLIQNTPMNCFREKDYDNLVRYNSKAFKGTANHGFVKFYDHYEADRSLIESLNKKARQAGETLLVFGLN